MKIYVASSWKNEYEVNHLALDLRAHNHKVDAFTDKSSGRYVFHFSEIGQLDKLNAITFLQDIRSQRAYLEDKKWLDWCDCCLLLLPAGKSSHLEAGYAKGSGKLLIIYNPNGFPFGEFDVMYGFADLMTDSFQKILFFLKRKR